MRIVHLVLLGAIAGLAGGQQVTSGYTTIDLSRGVPVRPDRQPVVLSPLDAELLQNPGFETGSLPPWTGPAWSVTTTNPHGGTYCACDVGNYWIQQALDTTSGAAIQSITFWARQPEAALQSYDFFYSDGTSSGHYHFPTAQWAQVDVTSYLNRSKSLVAFRVWGYSGGGPAPDSTYIDDVSIQTYGPSYDVGVVSILAPTGVVESGQVVTPACSVRNFGNATVSYSVRMQIGAGCDDTAAVTSHAPYTTMYLAFPSTWTASQVGTFATACSTMLVDDSVPANDKLTDSVKVVVHDIGVTAILAPAGTLDTGVEVTPGARWRNNGSESEDFTAWCMLANPAGSRVYVESLGVTGLEPGADTTLSFALFNVHGDTGRWAVRCSTWSIEDVVPENDIATDSFRVRLVAPPPPGWLEKASIPALPSGKQVKDGGWLAEDVGVIYAAKANKTSDFYGYRPATDSWKLLAQTPDGIEAKKPSKGAVGCSDGLGHIYATKGNNTQGFWKYVIDRDSWYQQADVPLGASGKKVKGGTDLVYHDGFVYCLKGYKNEFLKYSVTTDSWATLSSAPTGTSGKDKYDKGSWLVLWPEPEPMLYVHKAKYHELFGYYIAGNSWSGQRGGVPLVGMLGKKKKSKDGGSAALLDDHVYALKGGNTQEFWRYSPAVDSWLEQDTMPQFGSTGKKKKVKAGGDITASGDFLYALKGNKTLEFWRYVPEQAQASSRKLQAREGVTAGVSTISDVRLSIAPNPLRAGFAMVRFAPRSLDPFIPRSLSLYDAAGRCVLRQASSMVLDLRSLASGVYVVRVAAGGASATQKLVVQSR